MMSEKTRFPLRDAIRNADSLMSELAPACDRIEVAGSVRRGRASVADIEVVAVAKFAPSPDLFGGAPERNLLWEKLDGLGVAYERAGDRYRRFGWRGIPVDLFACRRGNHGWTLLVRTGSSVFSHHMAIRLNAAGYTSVENWITRRGTGETVETPEEQDVFRIAGERFVPPEGRSW